MVQILPQRSSCAARAKLMTGSEKPSKFSKCRPDAITLGVCFSASAFACVTPNARSVTAGGDSGLPSHEALHVDRCQ